MSDPIVTYTEHIKDEVSTITCDLCGAVTSKEIAHQLDHEAGRALPRTKSYPRSENVGVEEVEERAT